MAKDMTDLPLKAFVVPVTPFRLLSYAPSTESANQETTKTGSAPYPDWAMLDLIREGRRAEAKERLEACLSQ